MQSYHPLLDPQKVVSITIELGRDYDLLVITGTNTGGKTLAMKTIGIMILMRQSGLHIPAAEGPELSVFKDVFADIAVDVIRKNLLVCNLKDGYEIFQDDGLKRLKWLKEHRYIFDIIYLDPPFTKSEIFLPVMELFQIPRFFLRMGLLQFVPEKKWRFRLKNYGIFNVHFFISMY